MLRCMTRVTWKDEISCEEVAARCGVTLLGTVFKRLRWFGHVYEREEDQESIEAGIELELRVAAVRPALHKQALPAVPMGMIPYIASNIEVIIHPTVGAYLTVRTANHGWQVLFLTPQPRIYVDPISSKHGGELVAEVLKLHKIKYLFTLVGGHISPILAGAEKIGIRVVDTRHEVTSVFAADAVSRMSGTVGVAVVTAGPGVTNTITAVKNAQMAESPVLLLGGAAATSLKGRGALQDIDQMALLQPLCKFTASIKTIREIVPTLTHALKVAQSGTPGPVFVEFPIDTLYPYKVVRDELLKATKNPKNFRDRVVQWYLDKHLENLFGGAFDKQDASPLPVDIPMPTDQQIDVTLSLLEKAKKPVIVVGSQATLPPSDAEETRKALESLGIPCFLGGMARGLLGRKNPLHIRQRRGDALKEADVIILAGAVCDFRLGYGQVLNKKAKIIAINRKKEDLVKNAGQFWVPTFTADVDVGTFIQKLGAKGECKYDKSWLNKLQERDSEKETLNLKKSEEKTEFHLNPLKVLHTLDKVMADDAIMIADGGDFVGSAAYILRARKPLRWLDPGAFGTLGVGGGFALGAKLVHPESQVWIIYGDGSVGYSAAEFDTFTRHKIPVIAVVGNDACWTQISREQVPMLGTNVACGLAYLDYHKVAEGYGGKGIKLDASDDNKIEERLNSAVELNKEGHSVLVNTLIGSTDFRKGSLSV
ncbi:Acetolactate synthase-like protein [Nymphon striatum]|nr:Acetolactate synthase-like protein [Nymphon striatum]